MEERLCDQTRAYWSDSERQANVDAVIIYEQLKEAVDSVERSLNENEQLLVLWYKSTDLPLVVESVGYHAQGFIALGGKDAAAVENIALVPASSVQVVFEITHRAPGEARRSIIFMGHSIRVR